MTVSEKAAYIKGLMEGMEIDTSKGEGKILAAMADFLEDISLSILDLEDETANLGDYIEEIDEDLGAVEEDFYCCDDDCDCCDDYDCCDDDCDCCDDELYEVECPSCNDIIYLDAEMLEDEGIDCPNCGTHLEFDFDCDCCDDDCDCCDDAE